MIRGVHSVGSDAVWDQVRAGRMDKAVGHSYLQPNDSRAAVDHADDDRRKAMHACMPRVNVHRFMYM